MGRVAGRGVFWGVLVSVATAAATPPPVVPGRGETLLSAGERLYHHGLLPSGQPARALVGGNAPVAGTQAPCVGCHQRSGLGSSEGSAVAPAVTKAALYAPLTGRRRNRPAYTDATLATALRDGVDPAGQRLDPAMPRYDLPPHAMRALIAYLKTLSAEPSPGVTADTIHFATVTTDGVDASGMLAVLTGYFEEKNRGTRHEGRRAARGPFFRRNIDAAYRRWVLHPWALVGSPATWPAQLEERYHAEPVFAMISGMSHGTWRPVHEFCERRRIPCLLPNTDEPVVGEDGYYSLYFSQGLALEARVIAVHLARRGVAGRIVQVFRDGPAGETAPAALRAALAGRPGVSLVDLALRDGAALTSRALAGALGENGAAAVVLWLPRRDLAETAGWLPRVKGLPALYVSSTRLGADAEAVPAALRPLGFLVHPFTLPGEFRQRFRRADLWLRRRGVPVTDERILAQTYFACLALAEGLMPMRQGWFYRDFLLESLDHLDALGRFSIAHPAPSFGPGQRFVSKGSWVVDLRTPTRPEWIVP